MLHKIQLFWFEMHEVDFTGNMTAKEISELNQKSEISFLNVFFLECMLSLGLCKEEDLSASIEAAKKELKNKTFKRMNI